MRSLLTSRLVCILVALVVLAAAMEVLNIDSAVHDLLLEVGAIEADAKTLEGAICSQVSPSRGTDLRHLRITLPPFSSPLDSPIDGSPLDLLLPDANEPISVTVQSLTGRRVRRLASGARPSQLDPLEWNGCDEWGAPVEAGLYLIVVDSPGSRPIKTTISVT